MPNARVVYRYKLQQKGTDRMVTISVSVPEGTTWEEGYQMLLNKDPRARDVQ